MSEREVFPCEIGVGVDYSRGSPRILLCNEPGYWFPITGQRYPVTLCAKHEEAWKDRIDWLAPCPHCGFHRDTPNHELGCDASTRAP